MHPKPFGALTGELRELQRAGEGLAEGPVRWGDVREDEGLPVAGGDAEGEGLAV